MRVEAAEKVKGKTCGGGGPDLPPFELGLTGFADRLAAIEPNTLMALVTLTCLWIIWAIFAWTRNPFAR